MAGLLALLAVPAAAEGPPRTERYPIALPPAYPPPPTVFVPLPGGTSASRLPEPAAPPGDYRWVPGYTHSVTGIDGTGRLRQIQEYVPGHFER